MDDLFSYVVWWLIIGIFLLMLFIVCISRNIRSETNDRSDRQTSANLSSTCGGRTIPMTSMEEIARRRCNFRSNGETDTLERDLYNNRPPPAYDDIPPPAYDDIPSPAYDYVPPPAYDYVPPLSYDEMTIPMT
ncbi:hypothetical protein CDAR_571731 [Caerostris darwini]|uniref:Uncharacterized protein n=1 Tax=Caerostris darwini TaxID=1538125 RepID=A0AAV4MGI3_9ARAC|nr:hypothetical protein CDAR_571731 [Caerostris darwini]